jgi:exodeoxyribonuclease VII small subunit
MADTKIPPDIAALSFEDALAELEAIVRRLEAGQGKLDDNIAAYERGSLLRAHCETRLRDAQARIETIVRQADGTLSTEPATFK